MEKVINSYECLFIVDTEIGDDAVRAKVDKFIERIKKNAEIVEVNEWGKRRLAYPINDKPEGYYTIVTFKSEPAYPAELERRFNIDEDILRYLVIKLDFEAVAKAAAPVAEVEAEAEVVVEEPVATEE